MNSEHENMHSMIDGKKRTYSMMLTASLLLVSAGVAQAANVAGILIGEESPTRISGEYVVVLNDNAVHDQMNLRQFSSENAAVESISGQLAARYGGRVSFVYGAAIRGFAVGEMSDDAAKALAEDPLVDYVQVNQRVELSTVQTPATWGIDRIDQRYLPLTNSYSYTETGLGAHAYVVDTGIRATHSEFVAAKQKIGNGYTAIQDGYGTGDCNGHGTHVAGTLGGSIYGVAKRTTLHSVRVIGCGQSGTSADVIAGLNWVSANVQFPAVVSMSIISSVDPTIEAALSALLAQNVSVVVAAGNDHRDACLFTPARMSLNTNLITVGNSNSSDSRDPSSNWGNCVSVFAPGTSITSASNLSDTLTAVKSGTSMSTPHVSGVVTQYLQTSPTATPASVKSIVVSSATANIIVHAAASANRLLYNGLGQAGGTPTPGQAPGAPVLTAECIPGGSGNQWRASWTTPTGDIGTYELQYSASSTNFVTAANGYVLNNSWITTSSGWYRVLACNGAGCGVSNARQIIVSNTQCN